jgi:hypothetical protein
MCGRRRAATTRHARCITGLTLKPSERPTATASSETKAEKRACAVTDYAPYFGATYSWYRVTRLNRVVSAYHFSARMIYGARIMVYQR